MICGAASDLQFDHIAPSTKAFNCSSAYALDGPLDRLEAEALGHAGGFFRPQEATMTSTPGHVEAPRRSPLRAFA